MVPNRHFSPRAASHTMPPMRTSNVVRILIGVAVVAVLGTAIALWWGVPVVIGPDRIQDRLEDAFPMERSQGGMLQVTVSDPEVLRQGSDRLHVRVRLEARSAAFGARYEGTALVSASLRYDPDAEALHAVDARIDDLSVTGLKPGEKAVLMQVLSQQLAGHLERQPILALDPAAGFWQGLARRLVRRVEVRDDSVRITLGFG